MGDQMGQMLVLKLEGIEREIHPYALQCYEEWIAEIQHEIPLKELNDDDLNAYLSDEEKRMFQNYLDRIHGWLMKCRGIGDGYSPYPYTTDVIYPMFEIKSLLKKVYQLKAKKAKEEQRRMKEKAEAERRQRAEKEKEGVAERKRWQYNHSLNKEIEKLSSMLYPEKQNPEDYFEKGVVDLRYTGESFGHFLSAEENQSFDTRVNAITREKLGGLVSHIYHQFVDWECLAYYFPLPWSDYVFEGVPCLNFSFDVFAVVETKVWLKPGKIAFDGYMFSLPQIEHKCDSDASYFTELEKPEFLGYHYVVLTPAEFGGYVFWQTIPLVLVAGLINGDTEPAGATISRISETETTYTIKGFEEEVTIPNGFASYLEKTGGIDQMVSIGILSEKAANVIEKRLAQLEAGEKGGSLQNSQATGFKDEELISSLTSLGVPRRTAEELCSNIPKNLALQEATKLAMQNYNEIIAQQHSAKS